MATTDIQNASPQVYSLGIRDKSARGVNTTTLNQPQHLPKFYIYAESGPVGPNYVTLSETSLTSLYGDETFKTESKYYTHQTPFLEVVAAAGNNCVVHRLIAPDAKDRANVTMYLDILPTQVPVYQKNTDGSLKLDNAGDPITEKDSGGSDLTVAGYKVCWVADHTVTDVGTYRPGLKVVRNGVQVEGAVQSMQYPMYEVGARYQGEKGAKTALRMYPSLQSDAGSYPSYFLSEMKVFPFNFQVVELVNTVTGRTDVITTTAGAQVSRFSSKKGVVDLYNPGAIDFAAMAKSQYIDTTEVKAGSIGDVYAYTDNIETVLGLLYAAEKVISDPHRDVVINTTENNIHAINSLSFTSSNGSPYQAIKLVDASGSIRLTRNTNVFLKGTTDGTITLNLLDAQVADDMMLYNDSTSEYNDLVRHPESIIYDSGFSLPTKRVLPKFISLRKDTFITLATFSHINQASLPSEQVSVGIALKTMLELYPESDYWGTSVARGMIMAGSGEIIGHTYDKRVPTSYEVAYRAARYMGASDAKWRSGFIFDSAPNSLVSQLKNVESAWVPATSRSIMWSVGINFSLAYEVKQQFFPALQTVYENDTSVLNSFFVAVACCYLNKVSHAAWREFSGTISLTNAQFEEELNKFVNAAVKDKFDGKFTVTPMAAVTEADNARGYSGTLPIKLTANTMRTVLSTYVETYRADE